MMQRSYLVLVMLLLCGCSEPLGVGAFAKDGPAFDPVRFWTGASHSWGVIENRSGEPTRIIRTECDGVAEGADGLRMRQRLTMDDGTVQMREWHMRRTSPGEYEATANDMVGTAHGVAAGRTFHWEWTLATRPGDPPRDVTLSQWMYLQDDGSMMNRTVISKLGVTLAEVTEHFMRGS